MYVWKHAQKGRGEVHCRDKVDSHSTRRTFIRRIDGFPFIKVSR